MLEIVGVPRKADENTDAIVQIIADKLDLPINVDNDIEISSKPKAPIIVKFNNRRKRNIFYAKGRNMRLKSSMIVKQSLEHDTTIFINESLTFHNREIFKKAKEKLRDKFKYIWLKNGVTLIKKDDTSRVEKIFNMEDLLNPVSILNFKSVST